LANFTNGSTTVLTNPDAGQFREGGGDRWAEPARRISLRSDSLMVEPERNLHVVYQYTE
jgi:hypothetical protein